VAVGNALQQPEAAGVIRRLNERRWGRVWESDELLAVVERVEKSLGSP
jgi:hypothetical protein